MNYEKEVENMNQNQSEIWKPETGVYELVILSEPVETVFQREGEDPVPQLMLEIELNGKQYKWYVGKGKSIESAFGQLMVLGKYHKTLLGKKVEIIVQQSKDQTGKLKKKYMFPMVAKIIQQEKAVQQK